MATEWTEVKSSNIKAIGYVEDTNGLLVEFKSGAVYTYNDVPVEVYKALAGAESKGKYFAEHIKGVFEYQKVS